PSASLFVSHRRSRRPFQQAGPLSLRPSPSPLAGRCRRPFTPACSSQHPIAHRRQAAKAGQAEPAQLPPPPMAPPSSPARPPHLHPLAPPTWIAPAGCSHSRVPPSPC
ncbi:hypothetical protein BS78_01G330300, partial [Paspalum vaginatum]